MTRPSWTELVKVGDESPVIQRTVSFEEILEFARMTGDFEPIHVDPAYAARTPYGACLVHGVLLLGLMSSGMFAEEKVGPNVSYGYERVRFVQPVITGSTIVIRGRVAEVRPERAQAVIEETCHNRQGELQVVAHHLFRFL